MLSTTWGASVLSALLAAILVALIGIVVASPPAVTLFAAVLFGALLVIIIQMSVVIWIIWQSRGTSSDFGATMMQEVASPAGQAQLKRMDFSSLLTVAIVQELYTSLFKRDEPLWFWQFVGLGEEATTPRDFGRWNRYLEWALVIGLLAFATIGALLFALFVDSIASPRGLAISSSTIFCVLPAFVIGALFLSFIGLFSASVVRRLFILYALRADEGKIE